jgi:hypothetical protein
MVKLEGKIALTKIKKRMRTKLIKIIYHKFRLNDEIKNKLNVYKRAKKKIRNQNNIDRIEKYNTINLDRKIKLKINKTFTKGLRKKNKNQKNKDQLEKNNISQIEVDGKN